MELRGFDGSDFFTSTRLASILGRRSAAGFSAAGSFATTGAASFSANLKKSLSSIPPPSLGDLGDVGASPSARSASTSFAICFTYIIAARDVYFCPILPLSAELHPCFEKNVRALSFPFVTRNTSNSPSVHLSMFALFTALTCTPSDLCTPLQSKHTKTPKFLLVHFGHGDPQSKHARFPVLRRSAPKSASLAASSRAF